MAVEPRRHPALALLGSVWVRVLGTVVVLAVVASRIDWRLMGDRLRGGHPGYFVLAVAVTVGALATGAARWRRLLRDTGVRVPTDQLLRVYAISTFSGTFLPTSFGGDVTRALLIVRRGPLLTQVASTIVVDRIGGFFGLIVVAWLGIVLQPGVVPTGAVTSLAVATALAAVATVVLVLIVGGGMGGLGGRLPQRIRRTAGLVITVLRSCLAHPRSLAFLGGTSILFQALVALQVALLARAVNVPIDVATAAVAVTLVTIVTLIPLSVGGFGVREGTYAVVLAGAAVSTTDATLISLLTVVVLFVASFPGAVLVMRGGISPVLGAS